jgi:phage/plasmid-like protein (TIGR03299 family)
MAHEVEQIMYVGNVPWHNLGQRFTEPPTLDEAIIAAGLDWKVTTEKVFSGTQEELPALATRRSSDNKILGVVGPAYVPLQNTDAFNFFRPFIDEKQAAIETAGSLRGGQRVFVLAKLALDPTEIVKGDAVEKYVLLSNSHDGTLAVRVGFTPVRVVCANTLAMAHGHEGSKLIRVRHTKNVTQNLEDIRGIMNLANAEFEATAAQYRALASRQINQKDFERYVKLVFNSNKKIIEAGGDVADINNKRILAAVQPIFEKGRGNDLPGVKGTLWGAYNSVNEYLQFVRGEDNAIRLDQMWFGQSAQLNKRALETAVAMAVAA